MKYEVYVERKVSTYSYENLTIGYSQQFDDLETPRDMGFLEVKDKLNEWVSAEARRVGPRNPEPHIQRDPIFDMSNESATRRRYR